MKTLLAAIVVVLVSPMTYGSDTVRIATLNCEFLSLRKLHVKFGLPFNLKGAQKLEWDAPGFREAKYQIAAKAVAKTIARINADIICLTEVGPQAQITVLRDLVAAEGVDYPHFEACESSDPTGQHVAIFSKRPLSDVLRKIPGREFYDRELDDPDAEDDTGVSKGMHVTFEAAGQTVHLYVAHLASERKGHEQDAQRVAQASIVRRHYLRHLNAAEHVIVCGDLNDKRGQPALRRIRGRDDHWGDLVQTGKAEYFPADKLDTRWTYLFMGERNQIDHILPSWSVRQACMKFKTSVVPVTETFDGGRLASDHRALVVEFRFRD